MTIRAGTALRWSLFASLWLPGAAWARPHLPDGGLLQALSAIEAEVDVERSHTDGAGGLPSRIEALVADLGRRLRTVEASPTPPGDGAAAARVALLNRFVFEELGIRPSTELAGTDNLLPSRVLERRQGYCVGIVAIYLLLAERLDLPLSAVAAPAHVFLRYDDGTTRINIETVQKGAALTDEQYAREFDIPDRSIRNGAFLSPLAPAEFLAQVYNNLGVIASNRRDYSQAARHYERALQYHRRCHAGFYNFANDLLAQGEYERAVDLFTRSIRLYPHDAWALNNRGLAFLRAGRVSRARRDFAHALQIDPGFEQARRNLESLDSGQKGDRSMPSPQRQSPAERPPASPGA